MNKSGMWFRNSYIYIFFVSFLTLFNSFLSISYKSLIIFLNLIFLKFLDTRFHLRKKLLNERGLKFV